MSDTLSWKRFHEEQAALWQVYARSFASSAHFNMFMYKWHGYRKGDGAQRAKAKRAFVINSRKAADAAHTARYHLFHAINL